MATEIVSPPPPGPSTAIPVWARLWGLMAAVSMATRPLYPIDETRYVSVAWEMWQRHDFILPVLNGAPYSHKPPLLFWLIQTGWAFFGVNEWWPRLLPMLFGLANLYLIRHLARRVWGDDSLEAREAPIILLGFLFWNVFSTAVNFDMILTCAVLTGFAGLLEVGLGGRRWGWTAFALGLGFGLLTKGPVAALFLLPPFLLGPLWLREEVRRRLASWYLRGTGAALAGVAVVLAWAVPAALAGGEEYQREIFGTQTTSRLVGSEIHSAPWWWYLALLPLLLFPISFWPSSWRALRRVELRDAGVRFLLTWALPSFVFLSIIGSKRTHYLLPMAPALALLMAHGLRRRQEASRQGPLWGPLVAVAALGLLIASARFIVQGLDLATWSDEVSELDALSPLIGLLWTAFGVFCLAGRGRFSQLSASLRVTLATVALFVAFHAGPLARTRFAFEVEPVAHYVSFLQEADRPVAFSGTYHGQFQFLGRLSRPLEVLPKDPAAASAWLAGHPSGVLIAEGNSICKSQPGDLAYRQPMRGHWLCLFTPSTAIARSSPEDETSDVPGDDNATDEEHRAALSLPAPSSESPHVD